MFRNYLKTAWRNIKKHPAFSLINAGGLTIGIASCLLLLLYVGYHLNYDHSFKNLQNIYLVENNQPGDGKIYTFAATPRLAAATIKEEIPGVQRTTRMVNYKAESLLTYGEKSLKKNGLYADPDFFEIFSYHFIAGDPATALIQPNSIVLTRELATAIFGNEDPLHKIITRNNELPLTVTGVVDAMPDNSTFQFDFALSWNIFEDNNPWVKDAGWGSNFCRTFVQLQNPSFFDKANQQLSGMVGRHDDGNGNKLFLFPLASLHLYGRFENGQSVGGLIEQIHLFEWLAAVILLIACINFMNLSTARSEERAREVGIRKAIGSGRRLLIGQFITESLLLSFIATALALLVVIVCLPYFNQLLGIKLLLPFTQSGTWVLVLGLAVLTGLLSGSYPAFYLSSFKPIQVLKGLFRGRKNALPVRKVLVVVQFAFAVFLITATICIYRQIRYIQERPDGYDQANLVEVPVEGTLGQKSALFIQELENTGAILHGTGISSSINRGGNNTWGISWPGKQPDEQVLIDIFGVGFDFMQTAGVELLAGREYNPAFMSDTAGKSILINETAAKLMHLDHPIGTQITWGNEPYTIIGIYRDFVWASPYEKTRPMVTPFVGEGAVNLLLRLNPAKSLQANIKQISSTLRTFNPAFPPDIHFVDSDFQKKFETEQLLVTLAQLFGGLAIIISCLGLFGLAAYAAEQRIKEIGVRKVLGASIPNLVTLLSRDFIKLVLIAIVVAVPLSVWALNNWLSNYEFRITLSWWFFAAAGLLTVLIAILTVSYQAIKAALANPAKSLRSE